MHEHIARAMYYLSVHLLFASVVASAAWALTSIRGARSSTKYWIWVVTAGNFVLPLGAVIDNLWAPHFTWAAPLGVIGRPVWEITQGRKVVVLAVIWMTGALIMLVRLTARLYKDRRKGRVPSHFHDLKSGFLADGIPVSVTSSHFAPAVDGLFYPRIVLPVGIDRLLNRQELVAILLHEMAHAKRRDNLIRLLYEVSLCALWFHPLIWLAGARMALYRELACDEAVIQHAHGQALVSALAKLALPDRVSSLQASASSHLPHRLARLAAPAPAIPRVAGPFLVSLFAAVMLSAIFETVAHTACCFLLNR